MADKKNEKLSIMKLAGVECQANFSWTYALGARPYTTGIIQKSPIAEKIYRKALTQQVLFEREGENFKYPTIDIDAYYMINFQKFKKKITNILLLNHSIDRLEETTLTVADVRWLFGAIMVRGNYNMTWKKPEYQVAKGIQMGEDFNGIEEIQFLNEFRDRYRLSKYAYIKETIKSDGTPWSSLELLEMFVKEYIKDFWGGFCHIVGGVPEIIESPDWSDVTSNNLNLVGTPMTDVLDKLLSDSRSNCTVFDDGKLYVFPLTDSDKVVEVIEKNGINAEEATLSEHKITQEDNQHHRSNTYLNGFDCEQEMVFYYHFKGEKQEDENKSAGRRQNQEGLDLNNIEKLHKSLGEVEESSSEVSVFTPGQSGTQHKYYYVGNLINVTSLSYPIVIDGVYYEPGTYLDILKLLEYYNIPVKWLLHAFFDGNYRGLVAGAYLNKIKTDGREVTWASQELVELYDNDFKSLVNSISNDWWRTFRIDPEIRQSLLSFSASRAATAQYLSGARIHTPVWCNYIDFSSMKRLIGNKDAPLVSEIGLEYLDADLETIIKSKPTPFRAHVDGNEIISFDFSTDRRGFHYKYEPGSFIERPVQMLSYNAQNLTNWLKDDWFKLAILLTVKWVHPNTGQNRRDGLYEIRQTGVLNGTAPTKQIFVPNTTAKFAWRNSMSSLEEIVSTHPINSDEMRAYAASYTNVLEFQNRDWYVGIQKFAGCFDKVYSFGNCEVTLNFTPDIVTTRFNATAPKSPTVKQAMPYDIRRLYFGEAIERE